MWAWGVCGGGGSGSTQKEGQTHGIVRRCTILADGASTATQFTVHNSIAPHAMLYTLKRNTHTHTEQSNALQGIVLLAGFERGHRLIQHR